MPMTLVLDLTRDALYHVLLLAGPLLLVALVVGLLIAVVQAVTQIQEQTLSFVPKLIAVGLTFLVLLSWMLGTAIEYTRQLFLGIPGLVS